MLVTAYLKIKRDKQSSGYITTSLAVSKMKPDCQSNEVVTMLNFDIPDELFDKPALQANIIVKAPPSVSIPTVTIESGALVDWIDKK